MEADCHDLMSLELDEGASISMLSIDTHKNQLSVLSHSPVSVKDSESSFSGVKQKGSMDPRTKLKERLML